MKQTRTVEIVTGFFIILGFIALYVIATRATNIRAYGDSNGYNVTASFTNVGGLKVRAPVTMSGVAVGRVTDIRLDPKSFNAIVTIQVNGAYREIPDDTTASILTSGLLGEQYIGLSPGGSDTFLKQGSQITYTQSAIVLENLIGKFLSSGKATSGGK
ncbi:MAG TPA: outer membrane lipid asymmetry maintenance protein MlaD [Gammaproteobacteria bacterium]|jgi:phospholipid/cholesterol/gamma-HCH transport system substrate-binding protein|nr:outer membrane lipid asymmetry maintenance protein MlaD [Gammaproteobacteria bacterium]